jgi:DNA-binding NtrC family response regulator
VRELQNVLRRQVTFGKLVLGDALGAPPEKQGQGLEKGLAPEPQPLKAAIDAFEKKFIVDLLHQNRWLKTRTAKSLGVSRKTLFRKMKRHGLLETQIGSEMTQ